MAPNLRVVSMLKNHLLSLLLQSSIFSNTPFIRSFIQVFEYHYIQKIFKILRQVKILQPETFPLEIRNERIDLRDAIQDTELMEYGH